MVGLSILAATIRALGVLRVVRGSGRLGSHVSQLGGETVKLLH